MGGEPADGLDVDVPGPLSKTGKPHVVDHTLTQRGHGRSPFEFRHQETLSRRRRTDTRQCNECHDRTNIATDQGVKAMYQGVDLSGLRNIQSSAMTWDYLKRIRDATRMKCVIKGLLAWEDAKLAADNGYDAIIVSNHGARSEDSGRSTIDALPEIVEAVGGRIPIIVDSGFRRGTDIVKGLALGARAVCIGRPYLWGLGAFGQPGVERVLELLRIELMAAMQQCGAPTLGDLTPEAGSVVDGPAVLVLAAVDERAHEGARQVQVPEMQFDRVKSGIDRHLRRGAELMDDRPDLVTGDGAAVRERRGVDEPARCDRRSSHFSVHDARMPRRPSLTNSPNQSHLLE